MKTGVQLYTLRDFMEKDFYGTLKRVAEIGYKSVEFAGFYDEKVTDIKKCIDDLGLEVSSAHVGFDNVDKTCEDLEILGTKNYVVNFGGIETPESFKAGVEKFRDLAEKLEKKGFKLFMHNHWWEHMVKPFGKPFFETVLEEIPNLYSQLDLGWTLFGGYDPVERIKTYNDKIALLHTKDCVMKYADGWGVDTIISTKTATQCANGDGDAKIKEAIEVSKAEYAIVELDFYNGCMWEPVEKSYKFLTEKCGCEGNK